MQSSKIIQTNFVFVKRNNIDFVINQAETINDLNLIFNFKYQHILKQVFQLTKSHICSKYIRSIKNNFFYCQQDLLFLKHKYKNIHQKQIEKILNSCYVICFKNMEKIK